jgi:hypothetical protein
VTLLLVLEVKHTEKGKERERETETSPPVGTKEDGIVVRKDVSEGAGHVIERVQAREGLRVLGEVH